jgi:hypothetical protein
MRDLLVRAKHLFVAAIRQPRRGVRHLQSRPHRRRSPVARTRFKTLIYLLVLVPGPVGALASKSKYLAEMNKSGDGT